MSPKARRTAFVVLLTVVSTVVLGMLSANWPSYATGVMVICLLLFIADMVDRPQRELEAALAVTEARLAERAEILLELEDADLAAGALGPLVGGRDCSPIAESPDRSTDYGEGVCEERARIVRLIETRGLA